jgi:hypothetical protein
MVRRRAGVQGRIRTLGATGVTSASMPLNANVIMGGLMISRRSGGAAASILLALLVFSTPTSARTPLQKLWFDTIDVGNLGLITTMLNQHVVSIGTLVDDEGNTALHLASERCNTAVVTLLMKRGAKPDLRNKWNDTPLTIATARCGGNSPVLRALQHQ